MKLEPKPEDTKALDAAIRKAAEKWVCEFGFIPRNLVLKLYNIRELHEITPTEGEDFDSIVPIWRAMWAFNRDVDNEWLEEEDCQDAMAKCGFRIFEQEDYGYIFGIDGAGYDFYEAHWIPLYKARGLQWHLD